MILETNEERFGRDVLGAGEATVVVFHAPWCGHCRRLEPALEALAREGQRVVKLNTDLAPLTARRYGVGSLPTLLYFCNGQPGQALCAPGGRAEIDAWLAAQRGRGPCES